MDYYSAWCYTLNIMILNCVYINETNGAMRRDMSYNEKRESFFNGYNRVQNAILTEFYICSSTRNYVTVLYKTYELSRDT